MAQESVHNHPEKWEGKATVNLKKAKAEEIWQFLEDFCSFHKWFPSIDTCYKLGGDQGRPGVVRYCSATLPAAEDGGDGVLKWCHEKLEAIDPKEKWLKYEVLENNMGFKSYKSTIKVIPIDGGDGLHGCQIEWSVLADPVEGLSYEDLFGYIEFSLRGMAQNMEKALEDVSQVCRNK